MSQPTGLPGIVMFKEKFQRVEWWITKDAFWAVEDTFQRGITLATRYTRLVIRYTWLVMDGRIIESVQ